jgi:hypothetical protein
MWTLESPARGSLYPAAGADITVASPQLPQLIENYKNGRADALSLGFLSAWLVGDIANLIGTLSCRFKKIQSV